MTGPAEAEGGLPAASGGRAYGPTRLLALSAVCGLVLWRSSSWLTGHDEPWDADAPIWGVTWLLVAGVGGAVGRLKGVLVPIGFALGQVLGTGGLAGRPAGEFGILGWTFIGIYGAAATAVTLASIGVMWTVRRARSWWRMRG